MAPDPRKPRPLAFYLALVVALACVAAIAFIALRAFTAAPERAATDDADDDAFATGRTEDIRGNAGGARGLHIQVMDRNDRTRLAAELESETVEPLQAQRYRVGNPRATIYLDDGRLVRITADGGTLVMPDRSKAPEMGTLTDNVLVKLFEPGVSAADAAAGRADPSLTWSGSTLTFDSTLGEASTTAPFVLTSAQFEFRASDAKLLINQTLERLERFTVRQGGTLVYFAAPADDPAAEQDEPPAAEPAAPAEQPSAAGQPAPDGADAPPPAPREPVVTFYQAAMRGDVRLDRAGQTIASDRLDLFARTIDNQLPPDAIADVGLAETDDAPEPNPEPGEGEPAEDDSVPADAAPDEQTTTPPPPAGEQTPADPADGPLLAAGDEPAAATGPEAPPPSDDLVLTWTGPLEAGPLTSQPPELDDDHVFARFTAPQTGVVRFADTVAGDTRGQAALVEYAMTTRMLVLGGPAQRNVSLVSAGNGETQMSRLELDLATGEAWVPGPWAAVGADGLSRADCGESARLRFKVLDGRMTGELIEAQLVGNARATDGNAWIEANALHAYFDDQADGESRLRRLVAETNVRLSDGRSAEGAWQSLDAAFADEDSTPTSMEAGGGGYFRDPTARVDSQSVRATFRRTEDGQIEARQVWGEGDVTFRRYADQIEITGQRLFADTDSEFLEVEHEGGQARVARGPTEIGGELVRLHGAARTAEVRGRGSFEHLAGSGPAAAHIHAAWSEGMAYDDIAGRLECLGEVEAIHEPDALTRDTISAYALRVELEPASEAADAVSLDEGLAAEEPDDRQILTVYAAGEAFLGFGDELATIESARYAAPAPATPAPTTPAPAQTDPADPATLAADSPSPDERPLKQAFRLSGVEIFADNLAQTLDVPGRGRLFVADLRHEPASGDDDRGAALFDWLGSMHADRAAGTARMLEGVQMNHTRVADGSKTFLQCATLHATFAPGESAEPGGGAALSDGQPLGGLRSAIAEHDVYLRTDTRELTAALLQYDPDAGIARALASDTARVRVLDRASGSPMTASAVVWNLTTDRVDIVDPGTITIPR